MALMNWLRGRIGRDSLRDHHDRVTAAIRDANDGITSAAGITEGFVSSGASIRTLVLAGTALILAGGSAVAGARYSEVRNEWESNRAQIESERASIEADPAGELEELAGIYEVKGLNTGLARQVAEALTERDPVAAHTEAELRLDPPGPTSGALLAALSAGLSFGIGAAIPLALMRWLPLDDRTALTFLTVLITLGLTGWLAAWLTRLPAHRLVRRNILIGSIIMVASIIAGHAIHLTRRGTAARAARRGAR